MLELVNRIQFSLETRLQLAQLAGLRVTERVLQPREQIAYFPHVIESCQSVTLPQFVFGLEDTARELEHHLVRLGVENFVHHLIATLSLALVHFLLKKSLKFLLWQQLVQCLCEVMWRLIVLLEKNLGLNVYGHARLLLI